LAWGWTLVGIIGKKICPIQSFESGDFVRIRGFHVQILCIVDNGSFIRLADHQPS